MVCRKQSAVAFSLGISACSSIGLISKGNLWTRIAVKRSVKNNQSHVLFFNMTLRVLSQFLRAFSQKALSIRSLPSKIPVLSIASIP